MGHGSWNDEIATGAGERVGGRGGKVFNFQMSIMEGKKMIDSLENKIC